MLPTSGGTTVVGVTNGVGMGIPAVGIGTVRGMVDGPPVEGIPMIGVVTGIVADVPPVVPIMKGLGFTPAMGLVGEV